MFAEAVVIMMAARLLLPKRLEPVGLWAETRV